MINVKIKKNQKKVLRSIELNEIKMSKQQLYSFVKDELLKHYSNRLTDFDSYSQSEKENIIMAFKSLANGRYDEMIKYAIPDEIPFQHCYNATIVIIDDPEDCTNLELAINFNFTMKSKAKDSWLYALGFI